MKCFKCQKPSSSRLIMKKCIYCNFNLCPTCINEHLKEFHMNEINKIKSTIITTTTIHNTTNNKSTAFIVTGKFNTLLNLNHTENQTTLNSNPLYDIQSNFELSSIQSISKLSDKFLGSGAYGDVYCLSPIIPIVNQSKNSNNNNNNNNNFALKHMSKSKITEKNISKELIMQEILIHSRIDHTNIVKLFNFYESDSSFYMLMEHCEKGNLYSYIRQNKGTIPEKEAYRLFIQTCYAVYFLHENNIIHRDIKPENLLLDSSNNIKLCDFGWAVQMNSKRNSTNNLSDNSNRITFCGTFEYMAPEIVNENRYNIEIDVWSLGILLYEILHGYSPFRSKNNSNEIFANILKQDLVFNSRDDLSNDVIDLIKKLLEKDIRKRMRLVDVFSHSWVVYNLNRTTKGTNSNNTNALNNSKNYTSNNGNNINSTKTNTKRINSSSNMTKVFSNNSKTLDNNNQNTSNNPHNTIDNNYNIDYSSNTNTNNSNNNNKNSKNNPNGYVQKHTLSSNNINIINLNYNVSSSNITCTTNTTTNNTNTPTVIVKKVGYPDLLKKKASNKTNPLVIINKKNNSGNIINKYDNIEQFPSVNNIKQSPNINSNNSNSNVEFDLDLIKMVNYESVSSNNIPKNKEEDLFNFSVKNSTGFYKPNNVNTNNSTTNINIKEIKDNTNNLFNLINYENVNNNNTTNININNNNSIIIKEEDNILGRVINKVNQRGNSKSKSKVKTGNIKARMFSPMSLHSNPKLIEEVLEEDSTIMNNRRSSK